MWRKPNYKYTPEQERLIIRYKHFMEVIVSVMMNIDKRYSEVTLQELWTLVQRRIHKEWLDSVKTDDYDI